LLAMDSSAPRLSCLHALSLTTIASRLAPTKDRAIDGLQCAAFIRFIRVIDNDHRSETRVARKLTRLLLQFSDSADNPFQALFMQSKSGTMGHPAMLFLCFNRTARS
jgi:hypothetical protein